MTDTQLIKINNFGKEVSKIPSPSGYKFSRFFSPFPLYNDCITAFQREDMEIKQIIYRICFQLAVIDNDNVKIKKPDSKEEKILENLEMYMENSNTSLIRNQCIKELNEFRYFNNNEDKNIFNLDFNSLLKVASDDFDVYEKVFKKISSESNLAGYINRLTRNAVSHNYDKFMRVVPVFLLAAQIGIEQNDDLIFEASNYQAFIDAIRSLISENSIIYKSQTMLDEPSIRLHKAFTILEDEKTKLCTLRDKVKRIRRTIFDSIASSRRTILFESERSIKTEFDDFFTAKSYDYVEENYEEKSILNFNKSYNQYLDNYKVKEHISDGLYHK